MTDSTQFGFPETFALASDRNAVLQKLIPGTEDYYYYNILNNLNNGKASDPQVDKLLVEYGNSFRYSQKFRQLNMRRHVLLYDSPAKADRDKAVAFLQSHFHFQFNAQPKTSAFASSPSASSPSAYPATLDASLIHTKKAVEKLLSEATYDISTLEYPGLEYAVSEFTSTISANQQLRTLVLRNLTSPDIPGALDLIRADLKDPSFGYFGNYAAHSLLTQDQLNLLLKDKPDLLNSNDFVQAYMSRLLPAATVDLEHDRVQRKALIDRLWEFAVNRLGPSFNGLKVDVILLSLDFDRQDGVYSDEKFLAYLKYPKYSVYTNQSYLRTFSDQSQICSPASSFMAGRFGGLALPDEASLLEDYLYHFFSPASVTSFKPFDIYLEDSFLRKLFATVKLTSGNDSNTFGLSPSDLQQLRDRTDLEFAQNKLYFHPNEPVALQVFTKNIDQLIVKEYDINTLNYYTQTGQEVGPAINLDGIVPNRETIHKFTEPPVRRVLRRLEFSHLRKRGVYVIELIGAGFSTRAIVRVGRLSVVERTGVSGHVFVVLDEKGNRIVDDVSIKIGGHTYTPDAAAVAQGSSAASSGEIVVPFAGSKNLQKMLVSHGDFTALMKFQHTNESYTFSAAFLLEKESLIAGNRSAKVVIRPQLFLNDVSVPLSLLNPQQTTLQVKLVDNENVPTVRQVSGIQFKQDEDYVYELSVPDSIRSVSFELKTAVEHSNDLTKTQLVDTYAVNINGVDASETIEDVHLRLVAQKYVLELVGKSGEPIPKKTVQLQLKHVFLTLAIPVTLQSDESGSIHLGELVDIVSVSVAINSNVRVFTLPKDGVALPSVIHSRAGEPIYLPMLFVKGGGVSSNLTSIQQTVSLVSKNDTASAVADYTSHVKPDANASLYVIEGLPQGDYVLRIRSPVLSGKPAVSIDVKVGDGKVVGNVVASQTRHLELARKRFPLQMTVVSFDAKQGLTLKLTHATPKTRVHISRPQLVSEPSLSAGGTNIAQSALSSATSVFSKSQYTKAKKVGEEQQYIIDRKYAKKYAGNMLREPGLLLNPYAIRNTKADTQDAQEGERHVGNADAAARFASGYGRRQREDASSSSGAESNLDFLLSPAQPLCNLRPDLATGLLVLSPDLLASAGLGDRAVCLAVDEEDAVVRHAAVSHTGKFQTKNLSLGTPLDSQKHFVEQSLISVAQAGEAFVVDNVRTSRVEIYDSLDKVFRLLSTISGNATLSDFSFILDWPTLSASAKQTKFSTYACHELAFFLYNKDRQFFDTIVRPYYMNKKEKTFLDHWLTGCDLSWYASPKPYAALNVVERILLAERLVARRSSTSLNVKHDSEMTPVDPERLNYLFKAALQGGSTEGLEPPSEAAAMDTHFDDEVSNAMSAPVGFAFGGGAPGFGGPMSKGAAAPRMLQKSMMPMAMASFAAPPPPMPMMAMARAAPRASAAFNMAESVMSSDLEEAEADFDQSDMREAQDPMEGGESNAEEEQSFDDISARDLLRRSSKNQKPLFRPPPPTEEFAENNYYKIAKSAHNASLITANAFWKDYAEFVARAAPNEAFVSSNFVLATNSFSEAMLALSVLDLPLSAAGLQHQKAYDGERLTLTPASPCVIFTRQVCQVAPEAAATSVQVFQNYFDPAERYIFEGGESVDKFITEFLTGKMYGAQVVVTNLSGSNQKAEVLLQIPEGAAPLSDGFYTRTHHVHVAPYSSFTREYFFYFPRPGVFSHYPPHLTKKGKLISFAAPVSLPVTREKSVLDKSSWSNIAAAGSLEDVLHFIASSNLQRCNLSDIAWRMRDKAQFGAIISALRERNVFHEELWSYGLHHQDVAVLSELLSMRSDIVSLCGPRIASTLLTFQAEDFHTGEQFLEYHPLINPRVHRLGSLTVLNKALESTYRTVLNSLAFSPTLSSADAFTLCYYLLLQSRFEEAIGMFAAGQDKVKSEEENLRRISSPSTSGLVPAEQHLVVRRRPSFSAIPSSFMRLQRDYLAAYFDFFSVVGPTHHHEPLAIARRICAEYRDYPVTKWRVRFADMQKQIDEFDAVSKGVRVAPNAGSDLAKVEGEDAANLSRKQAQLAASEPSVSLDVASDGRISVSYSNLPAEAAVLNFYPIDIELLFSTNPFVRAKSSAFSFIQPRLSSALALPKGQSSASLELPAELRNANVFIEVSAAGLKQSTMFYSNALVVQSYENYGQIRVVERSTQKALPVVYVKVYARLKGGKTKFYKDGYTDLRGLFDYASLSNDVFASVEKFSLLVMSESFGSVVLEANPPAV